MNENRKYEIEEFDEERKKVELFRKLLYKRMAATCTMIFAFMAIASFMYVLISLLTYAQEGVINVLGTLAGISMTIGWIFAAIIAGTAEEVM